MSDSTSMIERNKVFDYIRTMLGDGMIEVELDTAQSARRLRKDISDVYGHESDLQSTLQYGPHGVRKNSSVRWKEVSTRVGIARKETCHGSDQFS